MRGGGMMELEKENTKMETKYGWEILDVIPLLPLVRVNHREPILHMSKILVHIYYLHDHINQFTIGYMMNPSST